MRILRIPADGCASIGSADSRMSAASTVVTTIPGLRRIRTATRTSFCKPGAMTRPETRTGDAVFDRHVDSTFQDEFAMVGSAATYATHTTDVDERSARAEIGLSYPTDRPWRAACHGHYAVF